MANTHSLKVDNATSDYAWCADSASLSITGSLTVECWARWTSLPGNGTSRFIVGKWDSSSNASWKISNSCDSGVYSIGLRISDDGTYLGSHLNGFTWTPTLNTFYHLGFSFDSVAKKVTFVRDGVYIGITAASYPATIYDNNAKTRIGADGDGNYHDGFIDEVRIYNTTRTTAQIKYDMYAQYPHPSSLKAFWQLNNVATDSSGNGNTLTLSGATYSTTVPFTDYIGTMGDSFAGGML